MRGLIALALALALARGSVGCSSFEAAWEEAGKASTTAGGLEGRWQGTWTSDANHHSGALRCILAPEPDGKYLARYHATYGGAFTFTYDVRMTAEREAEAWSFRGSADLGWLAGGIYEYVGQVKGDDFVSTYASKSDHGTFRMARAK